MTVVRYISAAYVACYNILERGARYGFFIYIYILSFERGQAKPRVIRREYATCVTYI